MNTTTRISARILGATALIVTVVCTALRTWLLQNAYRVEDGFYTDDTLHAVFKYTLAVFAVIAFAVGHIYIKEEKNAAALPEGKTFKAVSMLTGCVLGGFLLYNFAKAVLPMFETPDGLCLILSVFAAAAMLYYFTCDKKGDFRALLCLSSAMLLLVMALGLYFNETVSYVNHTVVLGYAATIFMMLTIAAEANFLLARSVYRRYLSYAPTAVALSLSLSIADLIYYAVTGTAVMTDIYYDILLLAFGIYHLTRLALIAMQKAKEES